jgi:hypothetical protein
MARSAGEVKADIALTRAVIERDLEALHRHVPKRSWLSYTLLAGGVVAGLLLSRTPLLTVVSQGLRLIQLGATTMGIVATLESVLTGTRSGRRGAECVDGHRRPMHGRRYPTREVER